MDYLLIAPLNGTVSSGQFAPQGDDQLAGMGMTSRVAYTARELVQTWTPLDVSTPTDSSVDAHAGCAISLAWLVGVQDRQLAVLLVSTTASSPSNVEELETALSTTASEFVTRHPLLASKSPLWVSRTALLPAQAHVSRGWLDSSAEEVNLVDTSTNAPEHEVRVHVGWGNNAVVGWNAESDIPTSPIVLGIADAQYLWLDLETLSATSSDVVHEVADVARLARANGLNHKLRIIETLSNSLAIHNLEYDDLLMHIQGARRAVGVALLRAWNYDDVAARISRRLEDTARILEQNKARQDRRYQGLVEAILFGLALAAFLELVLVAISAALDEYASGLHSASRRGIFGWLVETDPNILILGTVGVIILTIVLVGFARFRRR